MLAIYTDENDKLLKLSTKEQKNTRITFQSIRSGSSQTDKFKSVVDVEHGDLNNMLGCLSSSEMENVKSAFRSISTFPSKADRESDESLKYELPDYASTFPPALIPSTHSSGHPFQHAQETAETQKAFLSLCLSSILKYSMPQKSNLKGFLYEYIKGGVNGKEAPTHRGQYVERRDGYLRFIYVYMQKESPVPSPLQVLCLGKIPVGRGDCQTVFGGCRGKMAIRLRVKCRDGR
ncbi:hypothetical protein AVEN_176603-1 [Araneus ventricosus]|uniref:Uncharacterized protein n=1 Tax=Araneus ventricosus TaxID=182803 RepID=A0A4Y2EJS4_ARAVE|nr:hypothetical protein AVEN_176603-1 [Araneus ventricosus]